MSSDLLLEDLDAPETRPLSRLRSIFSLRTGIFTELERIQIQFPQSNIFFSHPHPEYENLMAGREGVNPAKNINKEDMKIVISADLNLFKILDEIGPQIEKDLDIFSRQERFREFLTAENKKNLDSVSLSGGVSIVGPPENFFFHSTVQLMPNIVIDTRSGPVILDQNSVVGPFSLLEGPLYAGSECRIDSARIKGGTVLGHKVRVGGEIEKSILGDCSNKHHDGFLGHSLIGRWVNLGAMTTTSDLKNNYGEIRVQVPSDFIPDPKKIKLISIPTGRMKFGSIVGDCVKTAIGVNFNTGSVADAGANIFGKTPGHYTAPFAWGDTGQDYRIERFRKDCLKIFARRNETPGTNFFELASLFSPGAV